MKPLLGKSKNLVVSEFKLTPKNRLTDLASGVDGRVVIWTL